MIEMESDDNLPHYKLRADIQAAMTTIGSRSAKDITLEQRENYVPNLAGACLSYLWLEKANLSFVDLCVADLTKAYLHRAKLHRAVLASTDLSNATLGFADLSHSILRKAILHSAELQSSILSNVTLDGADLSDAHLYDAELDGATLYGTSLSNTDFSYAAQAPAKGLTQRQLNHARSRVHCPPRLEEVCDVETGKPLEWRRQR